MSASEDLSRKMMDLVRRSEENSLWRQRRCINLIPSENTPSLLVKLLQITDPSGRYAEHRNLGGEEVYFYQGVDFIRQVEEECRRAMGRYFSTDQVEVRPVSGQMANIVVFEGLVRWLNRGRDRSTPPRRLRAVMNNDLIAGGHLSSQPMGALFNLVETHPETGRAHTVALPPLEDNPYRCDVDEARQRLRDTRPDLVVFGKSLFLFREPVEELRAVADELDPRPLLMFDMSHVLGLYGSFQTPLEEGADVVTGSTHKTFFGPQRGVVAARLPEDHPHGGLWNDIAARAFPGNTSNHHLGTLTALTAAAWEMNAFGAEYAEAVRRNARAFARALSERGGVVEGEADGWTETHQVVFRVPEAGTADRVARHLEEQGILTNYQALPDDESFTASSGIRTGTSEMTRFGMEEADFEELSGLTARALAGESVRREVEEFRGRFTRMGYCLSPEEAAPLAARLLEASLPRRELTDLLGAALSDLSDLGEA